MIRLNVGGVIFMTSMSTLQSYPNSSLAKMFTPVLVHQHRPPPTDDSGAFFIDSSPAMFRYVLDWCRYKQLLVDRDNMDWNGLLVVADYFGLEEMGQEVTRRWDQQKEEDRRIMREKAERHREVMSSLTQIREEVAQLSQSMQRGQGGGYPRPRGPNPPPFPGPPDYPFPPGPTFM